MSTQIKVAALPTCDFCDRLAWVDGKTAQGPWANMCRAHYSAYGIGLGTGRGQWLIPRKPAFLPRLERLDILCNRLNSHLIVLHDDNHDGRRRDDIILTAHRLRAAEAAYLKELHTLAGAQS